MHRASRQQLRKVLVVLGTRPEAIKLAPVIHSLERQPSRFVTVVCSTGQHCQMLSQALSAFHIQPRYNLGIMKPQQSLPDTTAAILTGVSAILTAERPDIVVVQGDTTTAFAASLAADYHRVCIAHVEAGLRTEDKYNPFPEEMNRRLITQLADFHFAPTEAARANLLQEGIHEERIVVTGNTVVDALLSIRSRLTANGSSAPWDIEGADGRVVLVTAHRRESFGGPLRNICQAIRTLARQRRDLSIVYPVHLNPNVAKPVHRMLGGLANVKLLEPLDYVSFVALMDRAAILLTDSGGLQEEGPALGKPVLVMRETSERPEAIAAGGARLVGTEPARIVEAVNRLLDDNATYKRMSSAANPYGDGAAAERIVEFLAAVEPDYWASPSAGRKPEVSKTRRPIVKMNRMRPGPRLSRAVAKKIRGQ